MVASDPSQIPLVFSPQTAATPAPAGDDQGVRTAGSVPLTPGGTTAARASSTQVLDVTSAAQKALKLQKSTGAITALAELLFHFNAHPWQLAVKVHARRRERFSFRRSRASRLLEAHVHWVLLADDHERLMALVTRWAKGEPIQESDHAWARGLVDPTTPTRVRPVEHQDQSGRLTGVKERLLALVPSASERAELDKWQCAWLRAGKRRRRSASIHLRLGLCDPATQSLLVSRRLDHPFVPEYVIEHVLWHEMVHVLRPPIVVNGRRRIHHAAFKRLERSLPEHALAEKWIRENIKWLSETQQ